MATREEYLAERQKFEAHVIQKAWSDPAFRDALLKDPKGTLESELKAYDPDGSIAADVNVRVVTESPSDICIVLPLDPTEPEPALLDEVSGGGCQCKNDGCDKCGIKILPCNKTSPCECKVDTDVDIPTTGGPLGLPRVP
ncbi:MAG: NHLP leader peptide family RiPP precursor [Byssovorax sp.]